MRYPEDDVEERRPAGPVAEEGPSPSQASGEGPSSTPPTGATTPKDVPNTPAAAGADAGSGRAGGTDEGSEVAGDLRELLAEAESKRDEYLELARRAQADFENYRKRMAAEVQAAGLRGRAAVAADVVPVLDDLERALQAAGLDPEGDSEDGLAHGVILVFRGLRETLKRNGVEAVDPRGERFDPTEHEALSTMAVEGVASGIVVEVMQKGYRMDGQLIRPARVVVSA
ncbi:MAG: nucleotide exchange factor GrpE [Actinobacteria bacterium]|nr:nucleotide exchange factor GrpE [Actinomycetota bacterium]